MERHAGPLQWSKRSPQGQAHHCIINVEGGCEEENLDVRRGTVCYTATPGEKPVRDAMSGQVLDRDLVAVVRQKALKYLLVKEVWL